MISDFVDHSAFDYVFDFALCSEKLLFELVFVLFFGELLDF